MPVVVREDDPDISPRLRRLLQKIRQEDGKDTIVKRKNQASGESTKAEWYYRADSEGGHYYTPVRKSGRHYAFYGKGDKTPTPKQLAEFLNSNPDYSPDEAHPIFLRWDREVTDEKGVELPPGAYNYIPGDGPTPSRLVPVELRADGYLRIPGVYDEIAGDIRDFFGAEPAYREMGIQYRRGLLLYGPPGNGKTSMIRQVLKTELPKDAVVIFMENIPGKGFMDAVGRSLKDRMKVVVFEELAAVMAQQRLERVLDFLDGEASLDKAFTVATTNYPDKLPGNVVDRPSRFDRLVRMPDPDADTRRRLLGYYLGRDVSDVEVKVTDKLSAAAIREVAIMVRIRKQTVEEAAKRLLAHKELVKKEFNETRAIGINPGRYYDDND